MIQSFKVLACSLSNLKGLTGIVSLHYQTNRNSSLRQQWTCGLLLASTHGHLSCIAGQLESCSPLEFCNNGTSDDVCVSEPFKPNLTMIQSIATSLTLLSLIRSIAFYLSLADRMCAQHHFCSLGIHICATLVSQLHRCQHSRRIIDREIVMDRIAATRQ